MLKRARMLSKRNGGDLTIARFDLLEDLMKPVVNQVTFVRKQRTHQRLF